MSKRGIRIKRRMNWAGLGVVLVGLWIVGSVLPKTPATDISDQRPSTFTNEKPTAVSQRPAPTTLSVAAATPDPAMIQRQSAGTLPGTQAYYYAPETSHSVSAFIDRFNQFDAVHGLGLPLTEAFVEN